MKTRRIFALVIVLLLESLWLKSLQAHGFGKQQLERVRTGPYLVSAWTDPLEPTTDQQLHVTIAIENDEGLVLNANIGIAATYSEDVSVRERTTASHENAVNQLYYEAKLSPDYDGAWEVKISVDADQGQSEVSFPIDIAPGKSTLPWNWIAIGAVGLLVVGLAVVNRLRLARQAKG